MEKYVTTIKDLVISAMTIGDAIEDKAEGGNPEACFQMGMINLLGVRKPISFRMAIDYFSRNSLSSNSCALRLLGFLNECDKNYSLAFHNYAKAYDVDNTNSSETYVNKVIVERKKLYDYLSKMGLPKTVMNEEISKLLDGYKKNKTQKLEVCSIIATLCDDEPTCLEAAEVFFKTGDLVISKMWLSKGKVDCGNPLYEKIDKKITTLKKTIIHDTELQIINLECSSIISNYDFNKKSDEVRKACDRIASESKNQWNKIIKTTIEPIKKLKKRERQEEQREEQKKKDKKQRAYLSLSLAATAFFCGYYILGIWGGVILSVLVEGVLLYAIYNE